MKLENFELRGKCVSLRRVGVKRSFVCLGLASAYMSFEYADIVGGYGVRNRGCWYRLSA